MIKTMIIILIFAPCIPVAVGIGLYWLYDNLPFFHTCKIHKTPMIKITKAYSSARIYPHPDDPIKISSWQCPYC